MASDEIAEELATVLMAAMRLNARRWDDPIPTVERADWVLTELQRLRGGLGASQRRVVDEALINVNATRMKLVERDRAQQEEPPDEPF